MDGVVQTLPPKHPESFRSNVITCCNGQQLYILGREALQQLLEMTQWLLDQGQSIPQIMEVLMPT